MTSGPLWKIGGIPEFLGKPGWDRLPPGNLYDLCGFNPHFFRKIPSGPTSRQQFLEVKVLLVCRETTISIGSCAKKTLGFSYCGYVELKFGFLQKLTKMNRWWLGYPLGPTVSEPGFGGPSPMGFVGMMNGHRKKPTLEQTMNSRLHQAIENGFVSQANFWDPLW